MKLSMRRLPGTYAVHRLPADSALPPEVLGQPFVCVLRTSDELSVCCPTELPLASTRREDDWICLAVDGPLDFALTGVVSAITAPLADAGVSVFVMSSFDTDFVMIKSAQHALTVEVLARQGIAVRPGSTG